jgi:hypothetical protein
MVCIAQALAVEPVTVIVRYGGQGIVLGVLVSKAIVQWLGPWIVGVRRATETRLCMGHLRLVDEHIAGR